MKTKFFWMVTAAVLTTLVAGCVKTVNDRHTAAWPFSSDKAKARYERPVDQVYDAAKAVLAFNGTVSRETALLGGTNVVKCLEGKVNKVNVWIRVEGVEPTVTGLTVQCRNSWGGTDDPLAYELDKQIALKLIR
jgi:hypothetical protein